MRWHVVRWRADGLLCVCCSVMYTVVACTSGNLVPKEAWSLLCPTDGKDCRRACGACTLHVTRH